LRNKFTFVWVIVLLFLAINLYGQNQQLQKSVPVSDTLPIVAYLGLTAEQLDLAHFKELADAGFTLHYFAYSPELNKKALELAQQVGVKLIIWDSRIEKQLTKPLDQVELEKLDQMVEDYKNYPALWGYILADEPDASMFENLALIKKQILLKDPLHMVHVNLLPDYANKKQLGTNSYQEYVDKYIQVFQPQFLSFDYYPIRNTGLKKTYYQNLEIIRTAAMKAGIPFWAFTMSSCFYPNFPSPKESWIRFQLYSNLAYGAKGLHYFTYELTPHTKPGEDVNTAIIDDKGVPTYLYDIAKRVNSEIHSLESTINQLNSVDVFNSEPLPQGTKPFPENFYIKNISGNPMLAGYFKDNSGQSFVLLVNRNYEDKVDFTLSVSQKVKSFEEVSKSGKSGKKVFDVMNGEIKLQFDHGDGRLFRILE
jgi:hypothetical protein